MSSNLPKKLFLSYARADNQLFVKQLREDLTKVGFDVWWDQGSMPNRGPSFQKEIETAIHQCERFVLVYGPAAKESHFVHAEWEYALSICKPVVLILYQIDKSLRPVELWDADHIDFTDERCYAEKAAYLTRQLRDAAAPLGTLRSEIPGRNTLQLVPRTKDLTELNRIIFPKLGTVDTADLHQQTTVLYGMGGSGKSTLAREFCHLCQTRYGFPDGILWLTVPHDPILLTLLKEAGKCLDDRGDNYPDEQTAKRSLQEFLACRTCLIVLDDVWQSEVVHVFQNMVQGTRNKLLVTTRERELAVLAGNCSYHLGMMSPDEALILFEKLCGKRESRHLTIAKELGFLPMALWLAGSRMGKDMSAEQWLSRFEEARVSYLKQGRDPNDPRLNLTANIQVSVDAALPDEEDHYLYHTLGIFREGTHIPQDVVLQLWQHIHPGSNRMQYLEIIDKLVDIGLLNRSADEESFTLHDLLHDFNREKLGTSVPTRNQQLLETYKSDPQRLWYDVANDGYLYACLPYHLQEANQHHQIIELLDATPGRLEEHRQNLGTTRDLALEHLILLLFQAYHDISKDKAHDYLIEWLKRSLAEPAKDQRFTPHEIAVRCALQSRDDEALLLALQHPNEQIRQTAIVYTYFRYRQDSQQVITTILEPLSRRITNRFGIPKVSAVITSLSLVYLFITYENLEREPFDDNVRQLLTIARKILRSTLLLNRRSGRLLTAVVRGPALAITTRFFVHFIRNITARHEREGRLISVQNTVEMENLLHDMQQEDYPLGRVLEYLDRRQGDLASIQDDIIRVFMHEGPPQTTTALFVSLVGLLFTIHGVHDPAGILTLVKTIFDLNELEPWRGTSKICMIYVWRTILLCLRSEQVQESWITDDMDNFIRRYYETTKNYGSIISPSKQSYEYYPMARYVEVWSKHQFGKPFDLLASYLNRNEEALNNHILRGFIIPSFNLRDYTELVNTLWPLLKTDSETTQELAVTLFARIRSRQQKLVDNLLSETEKNISQQITTQIQQRAFGESYYDVSLQSGEFIAPLLAYAHPVQIQWLFDSFQMALTSRSLEDALKVLIRSSFRILDN